MLLVEVRSGGANAEMWDHCRILKIPREPLDTQTRAISYKAFYSHKLMRGRQNANREIAVHVHVERGSPER